MSALDYTAPTMGEVQFVERPDGTRLRTIVSGSGDKTALLLHGYGAGADAWALVVERLRAEGMGVITFDQRGHGQSTIGSDGSGSAAMAADVGAVLEHYDVTDGTLVGHSMGGFLSIAFLVGDNPAVERVGSALLMATFAGDVNRDNAQNKLQIPLIKSGVMTKLVKFGPFGTAFVKSLVGDDYQPGMRDAFLSTFLEAVTRAGMTSSTRSTFRAPCSLAAWTRRLPRFTPRTCTLESPDRNSSLCRASDTARTGKPLTRSPKRSSVSPTNRSLDS